MDEPAIESHESAKQSHSSSLRSLSAMTCFATRADTLSGSDAGRLEYPGQYIAVSQQGIDGQPLAVALMITVTGLRLPFQFCSNHTPCWNAYVAVISCSPSNISSVNLLPIFPTLPSGLQMPKMYSIHVARS